MEPSDLDSHPLRQVSAWLDAARTAGEPMPDAMALATSTPEGVPSVRMVILRGLDDGLLFFTDAESEKGAQLRGNPRAAVVLHWLRPVNRQVRVAGRAIPAGPAEVDAYWFGRPAAAQANITASHQSRVVASRAGLEDRAREARRRVADGTPLPRPDRWGGWRVRADEVEFWEEAPDGLHDRLRYRRAGEGWLVERLEP